MHCNHFFVDLRVKRSVLEKKQSLIGFQEFYDIDRDKREIGLADADAETEEEIELRSYGSHLRFTQ